MGLIGCLLVPIALFGHPQLKRVAPARVEAAARTKRVSYRFTLIAEDRTPNGLSLVVGGKRLGLSSLLGVRAVSDTGRVLWGARFEGTTRDGGPSVDAWMVDRSVLYYDGLPYAGLKIVPHSLFSLEMNRKGDIAMVFETERPPELTSEASFNGLKPPLESRSHSELVLNGRVILRQGDLLGPMDTVDNFQLVGLTSSGQCVLDVYYMHEEPLPKPDPTDPNPPEAPSEPPEKVYTQHRGLLIGNRLIPDGPMANEKMCDFATKLPPSQTQISDLNVSLLREFGPRLGSTTPEIAIPNGTIVFTMLRGDKNNRIVNEALYLAEPVADRPPTFGDVLTRSYLLEQRARGDQP
jgi:hypothetical protein